MQSPTRQRNVVWPGRGAAGETGRGVGGVRDWAAWRGQDGQGGRHHDLAGERQRDRGEVLEGERELREGEGLSEIMESYPIYIVVD